MSCIPTILALAAAPVVSQVDMVNTSVGAVEVTYRLANGPAVITLDIETNVSGNVWASIGDANIGSLSGDVNRLVSGGDADTVRRIQWRAWRSWPGHSIPAGGARAVVTAWPTNSPPDYMVVDLAQTAGVRVRYYRSADALPGGLLGNNAYRKSLLVMRRIPAGGVSWVRGTFNGAETEYTHDVTLDEDYYIGVFPVTQAQWNSVVTSELKAFFSGDAEASEMRPMEYLAYRDLRESEISGTGQWCGGAANENYMYPNDPNPSSFLGQLRRRTGVDFDLPSESQWEFACRAGHSNGRLGDGMLQNSANLSAIACYGRAACSDPNADPATDGTPIVGTKKANDFGLYDMQGCVYELCLDWRVADPSSIAGAVNANGKVPVSDPSATYGSSSMRVRRGGSWRTGYSDTRIEFRNNNNAHGLRDAQTGVRVACPAVAR